MNVIIATIFLLLTSINASVLHERPYMPQRVISLIENMSLEEKVRQMDFYNSGCVIDDQTAKFSPGQAKQIFGSLGVGSMLLYGNTPQLYNDIQHWVINNSRLKIPVLQIEECLHGKKQTNATVFPQSIAMAVCSYL
jgi:beta-glucosidase